MGDDIQPNRFKKLTTVVTRQGVNERFKRVRPVLGVQGKKGIAHYRKSLKRAVRAIF